MKKYYPEKLDNDFVYPNNKQYSRDVNIVHSFNDNNVTGELVASSISSQTQSLVRLSFQPRIFRNNSKYFIHNINNTGTIINASIVFWTYHVLLPGEESVNNWRVIGKAQVNSNGTDYRNWSFYNGVNYSAQQVIELRPEDFGLSVLPSGEYKFEIRFYGYNNVYRLCQPILIEPDFEFDAQFNNINICENDSIENVRFSIVGNKDNDPSLFCDGNITIDIRNFVDLIPANSTFYLSLDGVQRQFNRSFTQMTATSITECEACPTPTPTSTPTATPTETPTPTPCANIDIYFESVSASQLETCESTNMFNVQVVSESCDFCSTETLILDISDLSGININDFFYLSDGNGSVRLFRRFTEDVLFNGEIIPIAVSQGICELCSNFDPTPTETPTPTPSDCTEYELTIGQEDLNDATGNTNTTLNNVVQVKYTDCNDIEQTEFYDDPNLNPTICVKFNTFVIMTYWKNDQESATLTSQAINTNTPCN